MRVKLRSFTINRVEDYYRWFNDPRLRVFLNATTPKNRDNIIDWINRVKDNSNYQYFSLYLPKENEYIGHAGLKQIAHDIKQADIGLVIGEPKYWRQGYGTEALKLLISFALTSELRVLVARIEKINVNSQKFFQSCGFTLQESKQSGQLLKFGLEIDV